MVAGEHGTSEVLLWSSASVSGIPVLDLLGKDGRSIEETRQEIEDDIRYASITIIEGTGANQYGIGRRLGAPGRGGSARRARRPAVAACCPRYEVILSLVSVLGAGGVQQMLDLPMTAGERAAREHSAASLREAGRRILAVTQ
jgi:L-lactate dehydrogenase